jgi:hypothetical protein
VLLNYHIGGFVLGSLCAGDLVWLVLNSACVAGCSIASACNTGTIQKQND